MVQTSLRWCPGLFLEDKTSIDKILKKPLPMRLLPSWGDRLQIEDCYNYFPARDESMALFLRAKCMG